MTINEAEAIYKQIEASKLKSLRDDFINSCIAYSNIRVEWMVSDNEKRKDVDDLRTRTHNALIDSCNILSRNMLKTGEDATWRLHLGDERKVIGDFSCYVVYALGISAG